MKPKNKDYIFFKKQLLSEIGRICRNVRIRNGLTQMDMSIRAGVANQQISKFESGLYNSLPIYYQYYKLMNDDERSQIYDLK